MLTALLLAAAVHTTQCRAISDCEKQAFTVCKGVENYKAVQLRGPYQDGRFELDFICTTPI